MSNFYLSNFINLFQDLNTEIEESMDVRCEIVKAKKEILKEISEKTNLDEGWFMINGTMWQYCLEQETLIEIGDIPEVTGSLNDPAKIIDMPAIAIESYGLDFVDIKVCDLSFTIDDPGDIELKWVISTDIDFNTIVTTQSDTNSTAHTMGFLSLEPERVYYAKAVYHSPSTLESSRESRVVSFYLSGFISKTLLDFIFYSDISTANWDIGGLSNIDNYVGLDILSLKDGVIYNVTAGPSGISPTYYGSSVDVTINYNIKKPVLTINVDKENMTCEFSASDFVLKDGVVDSYEKLVFEHSDNGFETFTEVEITDINTTTHSEVFTSTSNIYQARCYYKSVNNQSAYSNVIAFSFDPLQPQSSCVKPLTATITDATISNVTGTQTYRAFATIETSDGSDFYSQYYRDNVALYSSFNPISSGTTIAYSTVLSPGTYSYRIEIYSDPEGNDLIGSHTYDDYTVV